MLLFRASLEDMLIAGCKCEPGLGLLSTPMMRMRIAASSTYHDGDVLHWLLCLLVVFEVVPNISPSGSVGKLHALLD